MPKFIKKFVLSLLVFLTFFMSVAPNFLIARAQTTATSSATWYNPGMIDYFTKVFDPSTNDIFGERYTYAQVTWIAYSLIAVLAGLTGQLVDIPTLLQQVQANPTGINTLMDPKGKLAQTPDPMMTIISQFYLSPPASGTYWLSQKINDFSIVKKAYAAPTTSFGYTSLAIFQPLWSASRNIAYAVIVIIVLAIAFAVMFRLKINPQTVVTIQSAIPKIISALIFITFSYAIVGFLIDLMYLVFGAIVYGISSANGLGSGLNPQDLFNNFLNGSLLSQILNGVGAAGGLLGSIGIAAVLIGLIALAVTTAVFIPFVVGIFIAIALFFVKTFIMLAQTYLSLVINLVFGPIIILAEAIPFIKMSAVGWFMSILADILVFLAVGLVFLAESLIMGALSSGGTSWAPPYLGFNATIMKIVIFVGVWSILPNIRQMVYKMMERTAAEVGLPTEFRGLGDQFQKSAGSTIRGEQGSGKLGQWFGKTFPGSASRTVK